MREGEKGGLRRVGGGEEVAKGGVSTCVYVFGVALHMLAVDKYFCTIVSTIYK